MCFTFLFIGAPVTEEDILRSVLDDDDRVYWYLLFPLMIRHLFIPNSSSDISSQYFDSGFFIYWKSWDSLGEQLFCSDVPLILSIGADCA